MSFLPYAGLAKTSWALAATGSALCHVAVIALVVGGALPTSEPEPRMRQRSDFTITLEQLKSDILTGTKIDEGGALSDQAADGEASADSDRLDNESHDSDPQPESLETETAEAEIPDPQSDEDFETRAEAELSHSEAEEDGTEDGTETEEEEGAETELAAEEPEDAEDPEETAEHGDAEDELSEALASLDPVERDPAEQIETPPEVLPEVAAAPPVASPVAPAAPQLEDFNPLLLENGAPAVSSAASPAPPEVAAVSDPATNRGASTSQAASPANVPGRPTPTLSRPQAPSAEVFAALAPPPGQDALLPPAPKKPKPVPIARLTAQDLALRELVKVIRSTETANCLITLPRRDGKKGVGLALMASDDAAMRRFTQAAFADEAALPEKTIRQTRSFLDPRQCAALRFVQDNQDYPATQLGMQLERAEVPSGGRLTGMLRGVEGKSLLLLLVDNNGVVQDLGRFMTISGDFARFEVPVTRVGAARDTSQLVMAVATEAPSALLPQRFGQLAQDVFSGLEGDSAAKAALAIASFDVR